MKIDNPNILSCDEIIARRRARYKAIDGKALSAHLKNLRKHDLKKMRQANSFKSIPVSLYMNLRELGRGRYRAIVVSTFLSLLWDGWKSKKKTKRIPNNKVMLTRRMLSQYFGMCASTAEQGISDLVQRYDYRRSKVRIFR